MAHRDLTRLARRDPTKLAEELKQNRFGRVPFEGVEDPPPRVVIARNNIAVRASNRECVWELGKDYGGNRICGQEPIIEFPRGDYLAGRFATTGKHEWGDASLVPDDSRIASTNCRRDCGPMGQETPHPAKSWSQGLIRPQTADSTDKITKGVAIRRVVGTFISGQQRKTPAFADFDELKYLTMGQAMQYTKCRPPVRDRASIHEADTTATEAARAAYVMSTNADNLGVSAHIGLSDRMSSMPQNTEARFRHLVDPFTSNITVDSLLKEKYPSSSRVHNSATNSERHFFTRPFTTGYAFA